MTLSAPTVTLSIALESLIDEDTGFEWSANRDIQIHLGKCQWVFFSFPTDFVIMPLQHKCQYWISVNIVEISVKNVNIRHRDWFDFSSRTPSSALYYWMGLIFGWYWTDSGYPNRLGTVWVEMWLLFCKNNSYWKTGSDVETTQYLHTWVHEVPREAPSVSMLASELIDRRSRGVRAEPQQEVFISFDKDLVPAESLRRTGRTRRTWRA